jgi:hypothetical protein
MTTDAAISRAMLPASPASHKGAAVFIYKADQWHLFLARAPYKATMCGPMYCRTPFRWFCSASSPLVDEVRRIIVEDVSVVLIVECLDSSNEYERHSLYYRCSDLNKRVVHVNEQGHRYLQTATFCVIVPGNTPSDMCQCAVMAACAYEQHCGLTVHWRNDAS